MLYKIKIFKLFCNRVTKTFKHFCILTTQSFLGVVFFCPEREREREREIIYQNLQALGISDNQSFCLFVCLGSIVFFLGPSRDRNRIERGTQSFNLFFWCISGNNQSFWEVVVVVVAASCPERFTKIFNFTFLANRELLLLLLLLLLVVFCLLLVVVVVVVVMGVVVVVVEFQVCSVFLNSFEW